MNIELNHVQIFESLALRCMDSLIAREGAFLSRLPVFEIYTVYIPLHLWNLKWEKNLEKTPRKSKRKERDNQTPAKMQKLNDNCETN